MSYKKASFTMDINKFDVNNLYFSEPVTNNIIDGGIFYRIQYANEFISLNSIIITLPIEKFRALRLNK